MTKIGVNFPVDAKSPSRTGWMFLDKGDVIQQDKLGGGAQVNVFEMAFNGMENVHNLAVEKISLKFPTDTGGELSTEAAILLAMHGGQVNVVDEQNFAITSDYKGLPFNSLEKPQQEYYANVVALSLAWNVKRAADVGAVIGDIKTDGINVYIDYDGKGTPYYVDFSTGQLWTVDESKVESILSMIEIVPLAGEMFRSSVVSERVNKLIQTKKSLSDRVNTQTKDYNPDKTREICGMLHDLNTKLREMLLLKNSPIKGVNSEEIANLFKKSEEIETKFNNKYRILTTRQDKINFFNDIKKETVDILNIFNEPLLVLANAKSMAEGQNKTTKRSASEALTDWLAQSFGYNDRKCVSLLGNENIPMIRNFFKEGPDGAKRFFEEIKAQIDRCFNNKDAQAPIKEVVIAIHDMKREYLVATVKDWEMTTQIYDKLSERFPKSDFTQKWRGAKGKIETKIFEYGLETERAVKEEVSMETIYIMRNNIYELVRDTFEKKDGKQ